MSATASNGLDTALRRAVVVAVLAAALPLLLHLPGTVAAGISAVALVAGWSALTRPLPLALRILLVEIGRASCRERV